jgi:hypothetical protein
MARGAPGEVLSRWRLVSRRSARRGISLIARRRQDRPQRRHGMGDRGDGRVRRYLLIGRKRVGGQTHQRTQAHKVEKASRNRNWEAHGSSGPSPTPKSGRQSSVNPLARSSSRRGLHSPEASRATAPRRQRGALRGAFHSRPRKCPPKRAKFHCSRGAGGGRSGRQHGLALVPDYRLMVRRRSKTLQGAPHEPQTGAEPRSM